ncbi:MAG: crossover junction endodeoxyribonuclease RuvC [Alphaproteobacteria bacterium]|nr:crossover junction endodeoxyribonuclease RuvC [Alphaproteobacteria bacterium]MBR2482972.1 crossover junction endodeoxyribonuclease RuvC [Alphaproteobacteria bacterium]
MTKRVLGIDPGLLHTGWAVVDTAGQTRRYIASGVILPKPKMEMAQRLTTIFRELSKICETFQPDECSIEIIFVNKNPKTTLLLGQARAAAIVAVGNYDIPVFEYEPNVIKKALTGAGHADKSAVDKMVQLLLPNAHPKTPDEADAIAIALAHTNMVRYL